MSEELKVVISLKGERGFVGVQAPECDPLITALEGDLAVALERVPGLVGEARQRWSESPRYPECAEPPPSKVQPGPSQRQTVRSSSPQMPML